jgi:MFS family permease
MADEHKTTRTTALSLHQGAMYTGMLVSGALVAVILARFGSWRWVYYLFGGATIVVGVAFAAVFWRDGRMSAQSQKKSLRQGMRAFFGNPAALCAGAGYVALIFCANACMSWAPAFICQKFNLDVGTVGKGVMFGPNLAAMVTVLTAGIVTDFFVRRFPRFRLGVQIASLLCGVPLFALFGFASSAGMMFAMLVGWGIVRGLFQSNTFTSLFDVVPAENRASAVGFLNVFAYVIGSFAPVAFGFISQRWGVRGFEVGFAALGILLAAAAAMMSFSYFRLFYKYRVRG